MIVGTGERISAGGTATNSARKPSATPAQPARAGVSQRRALDGGSALGDALMPTVTARLGAAGLPRILRRSRHR